MLNSYQAKIVNNQLEWIDTPPVLDDVQVIITVLPKQTTPTQRKMPEILKGRGKQLGEIIDVSKLGCYSNV